MHCLSEQDRQKLLEKKHLGLFDVARLCGVSSNTITYWIKFSGTLNPKKIGRAYQFTQKEVELSLHIADKMKKGYPLFAVGSPMTLAEKQPKPEMKFWLVNKANADEVRASVSKVVNGKEEKTYCLPSEYSLSIDKIMNTCHVDEETARYYLTTKRAPYAEYKLLDLLCRGRVLPETWNHCFINGNGNLEVYQVGEVSEDDITGGMQWERQLYKDMVRTLKLNLEKANERIKLLESSLDHAMSERGQIPAANH